MGYNTTRGPVLGFVHLDTILNEEELLTQDYDDLVLNRIIVTRDEVLVYSTGILLAKAIERHDKAILRYEVTHEFSLGTLNGKPLHTSEVEENWKRIYQ